MLLSFFGGIFAFMLPLVIFFMLIPSSDAESYEDACWISSVPIFRLTFIITFIIFGTGFAIHMFTKFRVNYFYIFQLDPAHKVTHIQLYRVSQIIQIIPLIDCYDNAQFVAKLLPDSTHGLQVRLRI